ncbi:hypothetical protein AAVH_29535, partial [Aphelenchoides avenae]
EKAECIDTYVAEKLAMPPEHLLKRLDDVILRRLHHLSKRASQLLENLQSEFGVDATKPCTEIVVEKLSDADCRAAFSQAAEAAALLMQCHNANKEIRLLENPLHVKAGQCGTQVGSCW